MRLLIPLDESPEARAAADFAGLLSDLLSASAALLAVVRNQNEREEARKRLEAVRAGATRLAAARIRVRIGRAAPEITKEASTGNYDLLVMGQRGQRRLARMLIGNTALQLVDACPIPLIITQVSRTALQRILVCTSGSPTARANVALGARLASIGTATLTILHVMSQIDLTPATPAPELQEPAEWHLVHETNEGRHLHELARITKDYGITPRLLIRHGLVLDEILTEARTGDYDLVVLGANRVHGLTRLLVDDVTKQVLTHLARPVLVVP